MSFSSFQHVWLNILLSFVKTMCSFQSNLKLSVRSFTVRCKTAKIAACAGVIDLNPQNNNKLISFQLLSLEVSRYIIRVVKLPVAFVFSCQ